MAVYSGRFGSIDGVSQVTQWMLEVTMTDNAHSNSYTQGAKMRDRGVMDWTGSCTFLGTSFPGGFDWSGSQTLRLYTGGATWGGACYRLEGDAVWTSIAFSGDITSGARVQCQVSFAGDGALTRQQGTNTDTETPEIILAKDLVITYNNSPVAWKSFNFTINNEVQEFLDSTCYDDNSKEVWKKRVPGLIDCTGTIDWVNDLEIGSRGDIGELKIARRSQNGGVGDTIFKIGKARYMSMSGYTVDPSSGALVGGSTNFSMCAHDDSGNMGSLEIFGNSIFPPQNNN